MRASSSILVKAVALAAVFSSAIPASAQYDRPALSSPHRLDVSAQKTALGGHPISVLNPSSTDPLDGPHFIAYDVTDLNGNEDGNTGWTNLDVIGTIGVSDNMQALSSSTSTHSLEMGANSGATTYIEDCSPTGLPCLRFAASNIRTVSATTSEWSDFYVDKESITCASAWNLGAQNNLYELWGTKGNGSTPGILQGFDDRDPTGGNHAYTQFYTNALVQVNPSDNTTPNGVRVITTRLDSGADLLEMFSDGISVGSVSTAAISTSATTSFTYFGFGVAGGGFTSPSADFYEFRCWKSVKTDDEIVAITDAMRLKWRGSPLTGPSSIVWDARDMNGNGDANTGFTNGDSVGGVGKEWEGLSTSTATQSLQLVTLAGTAPTWVEDCSNGQPCVRFAGGSLQTASDAGWDDFFVDTLDETCVFVHKPSPSLDTYASVWGTRTLSTTDTGILAFYDGRTTATGDRFSTEGVWQSGAAIAASTTAGYTPDGKVNVNFIRNSQYLDELTAHAEGVQQGTVSTASRTATATGGDVFKMADGSGFPDYYRGDIFYFQCWEEDRPDAELVAIAEHLQGIYAPSPF